MVWLEDLLYMDMPGVLSIVRFDYGRVSCQNIEGQTWRENYTMLPGYTNHYHVPFPPSDQRFTQPQGFEKPRTNQPYVFCDGLQDIPSIIFLSQACGLQVAQLSWKFLAIPKLLVASKCYVPPLDHWVPRTHVRVPHLGPLGKAGKWHRHGSENETGWLEYREKIKLGHFLSMSLYVLYLTHLCLSWTDQSWGYQDWNWWVVATKSTAAGKPVCELFWSFKSSALYLRCVIWPYKPKTTALILTTSLRPCFLGSSAPFQWHWTSGNINSWHVIV